MKEFHDISDFTYAERADLFASLAAHFGEPVYEAVMGGCRLVAKDIAYDALLLFGTTVDSTTRLSDFMAGYLAGVNDTDNQNAADEEENPYMPEELCNICMSGKGHICPNNPVCPCCLDSNALKQLTENRDTEPQIRVSAETCPIDGCDGHDVGEDEEEYHSISFYMYKEEQ